jgi:2-hydroxyacyl-CoA lyase 1
MAWANAESKVRSFSEKTQVPFLRSPMGKGVMPDDHPLVGGGSPHIGMQNACGQFEPASDAAQKTLG